MMSNAPQVPLVCCALTKRHGVAIDIRVDLVTASQFGERRDSCEPHYTVVLMQYLFYQNRADMSHVETHVKSPSLF